MKRIAVLLAIVVVAFIAGYEVLDFKPEKWPEPIACTEQLPDDWENASGWMIFRLVYVERANGTGGWRVAQYIPNEHMGLLPGWYNERLELVENVTHWMRFPPEPQTVPLGNNYFAGTQQLYP